MPEKSPKAVDPELLKKLQLWADGKATLKDVRGYTDVQLYAIARTAYFFYYQGRVKEARTLFRGLYAVNPADAYLANALAVVEYASGNTQGALSAYDVAIRLAPNDAGPYVGRAEIRLAAGQKPEAAADLKRAQQIAARGEPLRRKIDAMLSSLR